MPLWNDRRDEHGPFDIIGDVHGCCDELEELLERLGYVESRLTTRIRHWGERAFVHPEGRKAVFLGDLVDRGPRILDTVRLVRNMVCLGSALCVPGNHDMKLVQEAAGQERPDHSRAGRHARRDRRHAGRDAADRSHASWRISSTGSSATTSSTTASWSSPMPG